MIKLTCPGCDKQLEIDDGFASGICRCYDCGTLMTVPADTEGRAEQLKEAGRSARPDRPGAAPEQGQTTTLVTRTGKRIDVSEEQLEHVAMAKKPRIGVRAGVVAVFLVVALGLFGVAGYLASTVLSTPDDQGGDQPIKMDELLAGITDNPYLSRDMNLMSIPIDPETDSTIIVIVDSGGDMDAYLPHVQGILPENLATLGPNVTLQVVFTGEGAPRYPDRPVPWLELDYPAFEAALAKAQAAGDPALAATVKDALQANPNRLLLVVHNADDQPLRAVIPDGVSVDIVQLGSSRQDLKDLAESTGGTYGSASDRQLDEWRRHWKMARGEPE